MQCADLEFVLVEKTSPRSLRLQTKARVQHVPRSHSSQIERCSVLVCDSCELSIRFSVFAELYSLHSGHSLSVSLRNLCSLRTCDNFCD